MLEAVNTYGQAFLSRTVFNGRFVLRMAIRNIGRRREDIERLWELIREKASELE